MAISQSVRNRAQTLQNLPRIVLAPIPLPLLQQSLQKMISRATHKRPELFARLGSHRSKTFLIDPVNMPFAFLLTPDPDNPRLRACRRREKPFYDARIAGTFLSLLDMIDGRLDGDALFFTRDLVIEGDTEAVVVLRNAMDDLEGSIVDDIAEPFGPLAGVMLAALRRIRG